MSEDDSSFSASEASYTSDQGASGSLTSSKPQRRRRTPRTSTTYLFAHPAPKLSSKKHILKRIRPTLLMQLQRLSPDRRPLPVIDVFPSSLIAGNVAAPRFSKRFPRLFGINGELGLHDTILVESEDYRSQTPGSESDGEDDAFEHRSLLAVLSPLRRGDQSEIVLEDGTVWTTKPLPTGSFDFVRADPNGSVTTARWVRRIVTRPPPTGSVAHATASDDPLAASAEPECKFTFSVIDPQSRRHPILATLTKSTLEVLDRYTTVSPSSSSRYPPSRSWTQSPTSHDADASNDEEPPRDDPANPPQVAPAMLPNAKARTTLPVDESLKHFISISAIWVSLQCGWGQSPTGHCPVGLSNHSSSLSRGGSGNVRSQPEQQAGEPSSGADSSDKRGRRLSARYISRSSTKNKIEDTGRDQSPYTSHLAFLHTPLFPRKPSSTGAAYVQRRKQLQMSDTSDSEHVSPASARRRSRAFSRLSGDFSSIVSSKSKQSPSPSDVAATPDVSVGNISPSPSLSQQRMPPAMAPAPAAADAYNHDPQSFRTPSLPRGGRSVSAYYATNPLASPPVETGGAAHGFTDADIQNHSPRMVDTGVHDDTAMAWQQRPGSLLERGGNARWKRLGSWFKRLGGH